MIAKITQIIESQRFEFVRERVGEILDVEIENQFLLTGDYDLDLDVKIESNFPQSNTTELFWVSVSLAAGKYDKGKNHKGDVFGAYILNIDVCTRSETPEAGEGDRLSATILHKILGKCRAILEDPVYCTLGIEPPYIARVYVSEFNISEMQRNDALNTMFARMVFNVEMTENTKMNVPRMIGGHTTRIRFEATDNGYLYLMENYG